MVYLFNENLFLLERLKTCVKKLLGRGERGPGAVFSSLASGLSELRQPYEVNSWKENGVFTACVLSGVKVLRWAIAMKKKGKIKKIVAGPNLVVGADDCGGIIRDPAIDVFIVPSQWVRDYYVSAAPELEDRIRIWPAGADLPRLENSQKELDFLVYNKIGSQPLARQVKQHLEKRGNTFSFVNYGGFRRAEYLNLLEKTKYLIYLSESESQGLAMFEAWARNVPVLAWERGYWQAGKYFWQGECASPYLTDACGLRFSGVSEFPDRLEDFLSRKFEPRKYIEENFSQKFCAKNYLEISGNA